MFVQVPPVARVDRWRRCGAAHLVVYRSAGTRVAARFDGARDWFRVSAFAALVTFGCTGATSAPQCSLAPGGRVMLASDAVDPDVFLWDSRDRLVDYTAGEWGNTRQIFSHTVLTEPGTSALVVACVARAAHPRYGLGDEAHVEPTGQSASTTRRHTN
jgi:hypothetical protein